MEPTFLAYVAIAVLGGSVLLVLTCATPVRTSFKALRKSRLLTFGLLSVVALLFWPEPASDAYSGDSPLGLSRVVRIVVLLSVFGWCCAILCKRMTWPKKTKLNWYVAYAGVCAASVAYSPRPLETTWKAFELVVLLTYAMVLRRQLTNKRIGPDDIVQCVAYTCFALCVFAISGWLLYPEVAHNIGLSPDAVEINRQSVWSIFPRINPNMLGQIGAMTAYIGFASAAAKRSAGLRDLIYFSAGLTTLLLAHSRTSFAALLFTMMVALLLVKSRKVLLLTSALGVAIFLLAGGAIFEFLARGQTTEQLLSLTGRAYMWSVAWDSFLENPWLGKGFYVGHKLLAIDIAMPYSTVDNTYLESLVNVGVAGTTFLLMFVGATSVASVDLIRKARRRSQGEFVTAIISGGLMLIMLVRSVTGPSFQALHLNALLVLFVALIAEWDVYRAPAIAVARRRGVRALSEAGAA